MTEQPTIRVNGVEQPFETLSIQDLLAARGIAVEGRGVAVARNGGVVLRRLWPGTMIEAGDEIEIIKAVAGG
ncbi:MAG TPA: sulfur carrier protein ThiS [Aliidongia sp.]|nr:sulfur carrier protein ThiS [Aliidongia sp.]